MSNSNTKLLQRVELILDIARRMAEKKDKELGTWQVSNHIHNIQVYTESAEPGDSDGMHIAGNWNNVDKWNKETNKRDLVSDLPSRLCDIFEKMGIEIEWSDETTGCTECGKMIRTEPDCYSWQPSFVMGDGEILCHECVENDPVAHLENLEGNPNTCNTIESIDPSEHGYTKINDSSYETGWHTGQTDDPKKISKELKEKGITRFLFNLTETSQFYSKWDCFVHNDETHLLTGQKGDDTEDEDEQS